MKEGEQNRNEIMKGKGKNNNRKNIIRIGKRKKNHEKKDQERQKCPLKSNYFDFETNSKKHNTEDEKWPLGSPITKTIFPRVLKPKCYRPRQGKRDKGEKSCLL